MSKVYTDAFQIPGFDFGSKYLKVSSPLAKIVTERESVSFDNIFKAFKLMGVIDKHCANHNCENESSDFDNNEKVILKELRDLKTQTNAILRKSYK